MELAAGAIFLLSAAAMVASAALAQGSQRRFQDRTPSSCQLQSGGESTVLALAGPQTLRLADGRFVRLAEILVPTSVPPGFDPSLAAAAYLRQTALGRKVEVKFGGTQRDRYGVFIGHVYVAGEQPVWLQEGLAGSGFAQVFPQADNHACSEKLLAAEASAREEKRGHWGLAYFKVLQAKDSRSIQNLVQTYQIVEGSPERATESGGRLTLHFGGGNKYAFTAIVEPAARKQIADKQNPESWIGMTLRLRGWIDRKRGPSIQVIHAGQIEFLSQVPGEPRQKWQEAQ